MRPSQVLKHSAGQVYSSLHTLQRYAVTAMACSAQRKSARKLTLQVLCCYLVELFVADGLVMIEIKVCEEPLDGLQAR